MSATCGPPASEQHSRKVHAMRLTINPMLLFPVNGLFRDGLQCNNTVNKWSL